MKMHSCSPLASAALVLLCLAPTAQAGEGGTSHIMPGANATLVDLPPTSPGGFFKPMFINYRGDASARIPTAAGVVANLDAAADTLVLGGGYGFESTVLGGAHYSVAAFLPYTWLSISGNSQALGALRIQNDVSGLGDLTVVPVMLAWKSDNWQYDFLMPIYGTGGLVSCPSLQGARAVRLHSGLTDDPGFHLQEARRAEAPGRGCAEHPRSS
jgi:hypothetical protein